MQSDFAKRFRSLRTEKGLSQRRAAADLEISQALLSHYENDIREPKLDFVIKACEYYEVSADYILGRSEKRGSGGVQYTENIEKLFESLDEIKIVETDLINKLKKLTSGE